MGYDQTGAGAPASWASTMTGRLVGDGVVVAHRDRMPARVGGAVVGRQDREAIEELTLVPGATRSSGAGRRAIEEPPDALRTCFERDRDRIVHSRAFRRLAGKTQVFIFPSDHQRTRLTHALEVAQVATAVARGAGLNVTLAEAIALGHDCGHGPGGHASEEAFDPLLDGGFHHAIFGADVALRPLNLCAETLDGIRQHSWSLPAPATPEGAVVSWADRCAYCAHDLEDAMRAGIVQAGDLPDEVSSVLGRTRSAQLSVFVGELLGCIASTGVVGMREPFASALGALRRFNYERIYTRPDSLEQARSVVDVLQALVAHLVAHPANLPSPTSGAPGVPDGSGLPRMPNAPGVDVEGARYEEPPPRCLAESSGCHDNTLVARAVSYVAGMTDRYAFERAEEWLGWDRVRLPRGVEDRQPWRRIAS